MSFRGGEGRKVKDLRNEQQLCLHFMICGACVRGVTYDTRLASITLLDLLYSERTLDHAPLYRMATTLLYLFLFEVYGQPFPASCHACLG